VCPLWRSRIKSGDGLDVDSNQLNGTYLLDYVDALKTVSALNKIPSLDLYRTSGINKYNATTYLSDGLHLTSVTGSQLMADKIAAALAATY
jgi:lysophospholipase L1-like esterase